MLSIDLMITLIFALKSDQLYIALTQD